MGNPVKRHKAKEKPGTFVPGFVVEMRGIEPLTS